MSKAVEHISCEDAQTLTDQIRVAVDQLWELLLEAHERKAWKALGYETWDEYVQTEFGMSRSRSYQLLDQGRAIEAIRRATGDLSTDVDISEAAARDIKPVINDVTAEIRTRVGGGEDPETAVKAVIHTAREAKAKQKADREVERQRKAEQQAEIDRQREETNAGWSPEVKEHRARTEEHRAKAKAAKAAPARTIEQLEAEIDELREANASLEAELAEVKAESAKWEDMRVQFERGGFEKVIADLKEEIRGLETRVESESTQKVRNLRDADRWRKRAIEAGWSNDIVIDLETGEVVNG